MVRIAGARTVGSPAVSRAKAKGTAFETLIVTALQEHLGPEVCRRTTTGAKDRGDIHGLYIRGLRTVAELKNHASMDLAGWVREAEVERGHDDAQVGLVVHKRRGKGDALDQYVTMPLRDLLTIITGTRPEETR